MVFEDLALALFVALPFAGFYFGVRYGAARQYMADILANLKNVSSSASSWRRKMRMRTIITFPSGRPTRTTADGASRIRSISMRPIIIRHADRQLARRNAGWSRIAAVHADDPAAFEPQTNFAEAKLTVGASGNAAAVAQCLVAEPTGTPNHCRPPRRRSMEPPSPFFILSDAGAGNYYETTSYRTLHAGQCWAVEYTIHSSQIGNYPPEYQLKPFDEAKLHDVLDRIVGTFKFL